MPCIQNHCQSWRKTLWPIRIKNSTATASDPLLRLNSNGNDSSIIKAQKICQISPQPVNWMFFIETWRNPNHLSSQLWEIRSTVPSMKSTFQILSPRSCANNQPWHSMNNYQVLLPCLPYCLNIVTLSNMKIRHIVITILSHLRVYITYICTCKHIVRNVTKRRILQRNHSLTSFLCNATVPSLLSSLFGWCLVSYVFP